MLNGLSLFTGYAGIDTAISEYVRPIMYCDIEKYAQGILLSRMDDQSIPFAPIWNDVTTLDGNKLRGLVDIIYGGFPCQDLSVAGKGAGLDGKRSGLFYEVIRLTKEINPAFVFLENVPAIRTRGLREVISAFREMGYDCRWTCLSASAVGANHKRERWFLLAHPSSSNDRLSVSSESEGQVQQSRVCIEQRNVPDTNGTKLRLESDRLSKCQGEAITQFNGEEQHMADSVCNGQSTSKIGPGPFAGNDRGTPGQNRSTILEGRQENLRRDDTQSNGSDVTHAYSTGLQAQGPELISTGTKQYGALHSEWWASEPNVGRVAHGVTFRVDRIKALGNGVVPLQVKEAFERLIGIKGEKGC